MSQKVLELAQVLADIRRAELSVELLHATGAQPPPGVPGVDLLEAVLHSAKECYIQQLSRCPPPSSQSSSRSSRSAELVFVAIKARHVHWSAYALECVFFSFLAALSTAAQV